LTPLSGDAKTPALAGPASLSAVRHLRPADGRAVHPGLLASPTGLPSARVGRMDLPMDIGLAAHHHVPQEGRCAQWCPVRLTKWCGRSGQSSSETTS